MRQQLRLRVLAPVAVLALLGAGVGAFAYGKPPADDSAALPTHVEKTPAKKAGGHKPGSKAPAPAPAPRPAKTPLERALRADRAAVVLLFTPGGGVDNAAVREARAGALLAHAGFVAVDASRNSAVTKFFRRYEVREAPAVLVFLRGPRLVSHFDGFADRVTVAQAVSNALR